MSEKKYFITNYNRIYKKAREKKKNIDLVCHTQTSRRPIKIIYIGKGTNIWHLALLGENVFLRCRHLVLWSLETLTGQHRFYGT